MNNTLVNLLILAYASTGIVATLGYWPTIKALYEDKSANTNIPSYIVWTFTQAIAFMYVIVIVPDLLLIIVTGISFVSCVLILILSIELKLRPI